MFKFFKILTPFIFLMAFFFCQNIASAGEVISIDNDFSTNWDFNNNNGYALNGQSFTAEHANLSSITIKTGTYVSNGTQTNLKIRYHDAPSVILADQNFYGLDLTENDVNFKLTSPIGLVVGQKYDVVFSQIGSCVDSCFSLSGDVNDNNYYVNGEIVGAYSSETNCDYWFKIYYSDTWFGEPDGAARFVPANASLNNLPTYYFAGVYNNAGLYNELRVDIWNKDEADYSYYVPDLTLATSTNEGSVLDYKINYYLSPGTYEYVVYLYDTSSGLATNIDDARWWFVVQNYDGTTPTINLPFGPFATSTVITATSSKKILVNCNRAISTSTNPLIKYVVEGFRDVMCFLFIPDQGIMDDLAFSASGIVDKAPIGYIKSMTSAITAIATSTTATTAPASVSENNYFILKSMAGLGILSLLKTILSLMFLAVAVVYIFKRIKHLIKV